MKILFMYNRFENMGIEILSSLLKSKGHEVRLCFDPQLFSDGYLNIPFLAKKYDYTGKMLRDIEKIKPDLIAFSVITDNYLWAARLARIIKKRQKIPIVFGGIHVTSVPERVMQNKDVDFAIVGEGEYALLELVEALENKRTYKKIKNLVYREGEKIIKNELRGLIQDLDVLPFPDKDLFYKVIPYARKTYAVMTARGCPNSCTYCFNHMFRKMYHNKGKYLRRRKVDRVINELEIMKKRYQYEFVSILDDIFMTDDHWLEEFCREYKKRINVPFRCIGHVNWINENNVLWLKKAGCEIIQIGIQTTSEYTRKNIVKRYETNDIIRKSSKIVKKNGIKLEIDHIVGFPHEGEKEQIEAAKFYNEIRPDIINCYWLKCFPRTEIIDHMIEDGRLTEKDVERIELGLDPSYIQGGSVKNVKDLQKFVSLFNMIPLFSKGTINLIIDHKLYNLANFGNKFMIILRTTKSIFWRDIRLIEFLSFYKYYMNKKSQPR